MDKNLIVNLGLEVADMTTALELINDLKIDSSVNVKTVYIGERTRYQYSPSYVNYGSKRMEENNENN